MTKRMLVDAKHPEEVRVAIVDSYRDTNKLEDFDFDLASKRILRGNIYLAKVMRIEPSLQAAFVEYGGNRHGFLPFSEIHPDYFRIPVADRQSDEDIFEDAEDAADDEITDEASDEDQTDGTDEPSSEESEREASGTIASMADENTPEETQQTETTPPLSKIDAFAQSTGEDDTMLGLITDFGNAAVDDRGSLTEVVMPEAAPESVGGDGPERIVRQHRPRYKIQEVLKRGQIMLIQVVKEERGNKGAALTTYLSLAGRYCVLMPNTDHGGGVSRKITNHQDRRRMKEILDQLEIPEGMAVILRTAGMEQEPPEIQRDLDYLISIWDNIREQTLQSSAPALIYEEANLIKRSVRDLYTNTIDEILVAGREGYERARDFMRALMPDAVDKIRLYEDQTPLFVRYQVENQIDSLHNPIVQLRSGGYLVINPTEALVSIDVNSGRATRERHIEETAVKTNLEAAEEIARQLRLRDLAGLVVIDFIDMEDGRNNAAVERRIKEAMKNDRARLQIGRISPFGLLELSRQRLRPSLVEINFEKCPHCMGIGYVRSPDSAALSVLRAIEEEALKGRSSAVTVTVPAAVAIFILNHKREALARLESVYNIAVTVEQDETLPPPGYKLDRIKGKSNGRPTGPAVDADQVIAETGRDFSDRNDADDTPHRGVEDQEDAQASNDDSDEGRSSRRRSRFRQHDRSRGPRHRRGPKPNDAPEDGNTIPSVAAQPEAMPETNVNGNDFADDQEDGSGDPQNLRRRRRGRRGGRRRGHERQAQPGEQEEPNGNNGTHNKASHADTGYVPMSIHELDTTPRPHAKNQPVTTAPQRSPDNRPPSSYEIVNPPTDQPKAGWWRRLTGQ
ncbi:MAG: ribonuclease E/G [Alphaproteobacteria bacterium]|nr:ribonuclease E/G [Alphaproteobacteria bacterium]